LILSLWVLYSIIVLGGKFRTRFNVSRMRDVTTVSHAVLFHNERMSSCKQLESMSHWLDYWVLTWLHTTDYRVLTWLQSTDLTTEYWLDYILLSTDFHTTWYLREITAPQISSPTINCSPNIATIRFSQQRDARPFLSRTIHLPPSRLASSYIQWRDVLHTVTYYIHSIMR